MSNRLQQVRVGMRRLKFSGRWPKQLGWRIQKVVGWSIFLSCFPGVSRRGEGDSVLDDTVNVDVVVQSEHAHVIRVIHA